jgi:uncharacterized protein (TIGR02246 family)
MQSLRRALVMASAFFMGAATLSSAGTGRTAAGGRSMLAQEEPGYSSQRPSIEIITPGEIEDEIAKSRDVWVALWNTRQINQVLTLYAPDAMFLTASGERATGLFEIRYLFERMRNSNTSDLKLHSLAFEQSGDLAYDSGSYTETMALPDNPHHEIRGSYLAVYKHQPDGRWLIVQHVWTAASTPHVEIKPLAGP